MKKHISFLLIAALSIHLSACSLWQDAEEEKKTIDTTVPKIEKETQEPTVEKKEPPKPFNFETELTEDEIAFFTEGDDFYTLISSTPYYMSENSLALPAFTEFEALKKAKIEEAITMTDELRALVKKLEAQILPFKVALYEFMNVVYEHDSELKDFGEGVASNFLQFSIKTGVVKTHLAFIDGESSDDPLVQSFLDYQKTMRVLQLADTVYRDLGFVLGNSSQLNGATADSENPEIKKAHKAFETQMEKVESLNEVLTSINQKTAQIGLVLQQIETADYQMGQASLEFIKEQVPELKKQLATLQPSDQLSAEDVEFIKEYTETFDDFADDMETVMENVDTDRLLLSEAPVQNRFIPVAHADFTDKLKGALSTLKEGADMAAEGTKLVWSGLTTAGGVVLDAGDAVAASAADIGFGLYSDESAEEIFGHVYNNVKQVGENFQAGASGSKVLKTAGEYLEYAETGTDEWIAEQVAKQTGKGWTSWLAGKTGKLTVGLFTQLGKGIYKVTNTQSTRGDYAEGLVDISFSFIGGSKVVLKGSQVLKGGAGSIKLLGKKGVNFVKNSWNNVKLADLRVLYAEAVKRGGDDAAKFMQKYGDQILRREALIETLDNARKAINDEVAKAISEAGQAVLKNIKDTKGAFLEFTKEIYDGATIANIVKAIRDTMGKNAAEYFDNLAGNVIDDMIKGVIKEFVEEAFGKFGGTYSGVAEVEGYGFPVTIEVEGPIFTGQTATTIEVPFFGGETIRIDVAAQINGTINETGGILANLAGTAKAEGEVTHFTGSFGGGITETTMTVNNLYFISDGRYGPYKAKLTKK